MYKAKRGHLRLGELMRMCAKLKDLRSISFVLTAAEISGKPKYVVNCIARYYDKRVYQAMCGKRWDNAFLYGGKE